MVNEHVRMGTARIEHHGIIGMGFQTYLIDNDQINGQKETEE